MKFLCVTVCPFINYVLNQPDENIILTRRNVYKIIDVVVTLELANLPVSLHYGLAKPANSVDKLYISDFNFNSTYTFNPTKFLPISVNLFLISHQSVDGSVLSLFKKNIYLFVELIYYNHNIILWCRLSIVPEFLAACP